MLLENYDIFYGIIDHGLYDKRPFSLMEMHDSERFDIVNPLYEIFEKYVENDVLKYTGIPLDRFIELPRDRVLKIFEICIKHREIESKKAAPIIDQLEQLNKIGK